MASLTTEGLVRKFLDRSRERKLNIICVGDAMIDEYYQVQVNRISPEFPMPIMCSIHDNPIIRPGGAANVVHQLKHFDVCADLVCFADKKLRKTLNAHNITCDPVTTDNALEAYKGHVPVKRRFLHDSIQVNRWDIEDIAYGLNVDVLGQLQSKYAKSMEKRSTDVVIFSDYNKGFFQNLEYNEQIDWIKVFPNAITIVDPKTGPLDKWKGCTIFKPNANEARELSGKGFWREQAKFLQNALECQSVVITCGGEKVCGVYKGDFFNYTANKKVEVESVVGAGDCFCAFFAMAVGLGFDVPEAAEIGWNAGSIYVQNNMNRPIVPAELFEDKIVQPEDLVNRDFELVLANGCFDMLHSGHINLLRFAKSKGSKLVVAVNSDQSVKKLKGENRPIMPLTERMKVLAEIKDVDFVVSFEEENPHEIIKMIKPNVLVKGAEYKKYEIIGAELVAEICLAPMIPNISTTKLLNK